MNDKVKKHKIIYFIIFIFFLLFISINSLDKCNLNTPIMKNNNCVLDYCTDEQYEDSTCIIENEIVKTQWLTNIIWVGEQYFRYIGFAEFSTNDLIFEATSYPGSSKRMFYGLQGDGSYLFNLNGVKTPYFSKDVEGQTDNDDNKRYEAELFVAKKIDTGKEYLISIPRYSQYMELYDFEGGTIYQKKASEVLVERMISIRQSSHNFISSDNQNYVILSYASDNGKSKNPISLYVHKFALNSISNNGFKSINYYTESDIVGNSLGCFITKLNYIICIYLTKSDSNSISIFNIIALDSELDKLTSLTLEYPSYNEEAFIKCIHYKDEIGIFTYYTTENEILVPTIKFLEYDNTNLGSFKNYLDNYEEIKLSKSFDSDCQLNDIIKISEYKICYIAPSTDRENLYVIILNIYGTEKIIIKYYKIQLYILYHYKILLEIMSHLYNKFIAFGFSFCQITNCTVEAGEYYSGFMIFSYSNTIDTSLNLDDYLFDNNIDIDDFEINLAENTKIENNIFGYIYSGIKILQKDNCDNINLVSSLNETKNIEVNTILEENENIKIKSLNSDYYSEFDCTLKYVYIITEPDYGIYNSYITYKDETYGIDSETLYKSQIEEYEGRNGYYQFTLNNKLEKNNCNLNCLLCLKETPDYCITCKYNYTLEKVNNEDMKICNDTLEETDLITVQTTMIQEINLKTTQTTIIQETDLKNIQTTVIQETDFSSDISKDVEEVDYTTEKNTNSEENDVIYETIIIETQKDIFKELKDELLSDDYSGENKIVIKDNMIYQISTVDEQKKYNINISSIDLGECENVLKETYNIAYNNSILIIKVDTKNEDTNATYVQYELFHPINKTLLDLNYCSNLKIYISVPVKFNQEMLSLYESLGDLGYNLFDEKSSFYNDICTPYTTKNNTDILLKDRQQDIYNEYANSLCQSGCLPSSYDKYTKRAVCNCEIKKNINIELNITKIFSYMDNIPELFFETISNSNFRILKCYKLAFSTKDIFKNKGRIIMIIIYFLYLIMLIVYLIQDRKRINKHLRKIIRNKMNISNNEITKLNKNIFTQINDDKKKTNIKKDKGKNKDKGKKKIKNKKEKIWKTKNIPPKRKTQKIEGNRKKHVNRKESEIKLSKNSYSNTNRLLSERSEKKSHNKHSKNKVTIIDINIYPNQKKIDKNMNNLKDKNMIKTKKVIFHKNTINTINLKSLEKNNKFIKLNDNELNELKYEEAIIHDKRTYLQYYWSLLKKKQLILFTFFPQEDYNLITLKISLFLLSFSLYFTINGFFFTDSTMHKVYVDQGVYNIIIQIPQILYSSVVSAVINSLLKLLSLSERNILVIKHEENLKEIKNISKRNKIYLNIKFTLFFLVSNLLLLFFLYFISCFCGVYTNSQIILIKDTFFSFLLSMLYPFGLNLLPGMFRLPSLKAKTKDKKFLYKFSNFIALLL